MKKSVGSHVKLFSFRLTPTRTSCEVGYFLHHTGRHVITKAAPSYGAINAFFNALLLYLEHAAICLHEDEQYVILRIFSSTVLEDGIRCHLRNTIGCRKRMRTGKRGTAGDPISANGSGAPCARIIRPAGRPGISSRTTRPARTPTAGARTACWASATTSSNSVSPWPCGMRPTPS